MKANHDNPITTASHIHLMTIGLSVQYYDPETHIARPSFSICGKWSSIDGDPIVAYRIQEAMSTSNSKKTFMSVMDYRRGGA